MNREPVVLFLHIPKAGGTTLSNWIFEQVKNVDDTKEEGRWLKNGVLFYPSGFVRGPYPDDLRIIQRTLQYSQLKAVLGHFSFGIHKELNAPSTYVTIMREPVERVVSLFHFQKLIESRQGTHQGVKIPDDMTLRDFVETTPYPEVDNGQTRRIAGVNVTAKKCPREALDMAKENIERLFAVTGILERFDETLVMIKRAFGWERESVYYQRNENPNRPAVSVIPDDILEVIRARNELDCDLYSFVKMRFEASLELQGDDFREAVRRFKHEQESLRQNILRQLQNNGIGG